MAVWNVMSAVARVLGAVGGDLRLELVADRQQHFLGVVEVAALLAVVLEHARLDDRVDRAALLAEAAEDALREVDVVARRPARAVVADVALDRDRQRRADRLAQLAGDAALLAVLVAAQRVQAAKARAERSLLLGILHRHLLGEEVAAGELHALEQLAEHEAREEVPDRCCFASHGYFQMFQGDWITRPTTTSQTS